MSNHAKLTPEDFIAAGYNKFKSNFKEQAYCGLQKTFRDERGRRKYFITVWVYDFSAYRDRLPADHNNWAFEPDINLFVRDTRFPDLFRAIRISYDFVSVEDLEEFTEKQYVHFGSVPDIWNND